LNKESLEKVRELVIDVIDNSEIPVTDKVELLLNLYHFLDPEKYEKNIKTLTKQL
jgi:hypothetical protein